MSLSEAIFCCLPKKKKKKLCSKKCEVLLITLLAAFITIASIFGFVKGLGLQKCD
jgi:hypothetical protein